jgi:magnesium-dependent phosphatase 1
MHDVVKHKVWGVGTKIAHFKELQSRTGVAFEDMLFFDDESRNRDVERKLGVMLILVENGVTRSVFESAISRWREARGSSL